MLVVRRPYPWVRKDHDTMTPEWPDPDDEDYRPPRQLLQDLERLMGASCVQCAHRLCGHEALFSVAMGFKNAPRCLTCLARVLDWSPQDLRDHLVSHFQHRDCYGHAWGVASGRESFGPGWTPACLWTNEEALAEAVPERPSLASPETVDEALEVADAWDAGDMACGDLVLALRGRLNSLAPGAVLRLTARDPAAPEDLPAWCRLTGHRLWRAQHPEYLIQRKE